jgi:mannose-6-phosphate isomerase-like protein (cupin superfamily)
MKRLVGSNNLMPLLKNEIVSYDRYESGDLKVIGFPEYPNSDIVVRDFMSYAEWLSSYQQYPIIKVEGLDDTIASSRSVHLFYNQKSRYSFKWHTDPVNICLHVVKGVKMLQVKQRSYRLVAGQWASIPKNHLHRAYSVAGTWALSIEV